MYSTALGIQTFGVISLVAAFTKCTIEKRKTIHAKEHDKNL